jgi:hypothetical protein
VRGREQVRTREENQSLIRSISSSVSRSLGAVIELGGAGAFMRRHRLGVLKSSAIFQVCRDPGRTESIAADRRLDASGLRPATEHAPAGRPVFIGCWASMLAFQPSGVRNSHCLRSSPMPVAAM